MANLTRIKILTTGSTTAAPSNLKTGEFAYSYVSGTQANNGDRLYIGTGTETGGVAASVDLIGGKYFTQLLDHVHGTATASSAVILDSNKHLSDIAIGSLQLGSSGGSGQAVTSITTSTTLSGAANTQIPTALAVKTYVDAEVTAQDLDFQGDTGGAQNVDLDSQTMTIAGTANEIETAGSAQTLTIGLPDDVTISNTLTVSGSSGTVLDVAGQTELASLNVEDLTNNKIVIAGTDGELETDANFGFDGTEFAIQSGGTDKFTVQVSSGNTVIDGTLNVNGNVNLGNALSDNVVIAGNLTVQGTTTSVESTTITIDDPVIALADNTSSNTSDGLDRGVRFKWGTGSAVATGFFGFDIQTERFVFTKDETVTSDNFSSPFSDAQFGNIFSTGSTLGNIQVGITGDNEIDTTSGNLTIDSAGGTVTVDDDLTVTGAASAASLTLTTDLAVAHGGTGVSSFTGDAVIVSNAGGTALSYLTSSLGTVGDIVQFNGSGVPVVSNIIDGGTY